MNKSTTFCVTILLLCFNSFKTYACICDPLDFIEDTSSLNSYDFVAHVYVTDVKEMKYENVHKIADRGMVFFEILTLFKGDTVNQVLDLTRNSTCYYTVKEEQEWVLFARSVNDTLRIEICDYNQIYRMADGEIHSNMPDYLNDLKSIYGVKKVRPSNGTDVSYYRNGQKEIQVTYKNDLVHGAYTAWYPSGRMSYQANYVNGKPQGWVKNFHKNGAIKCLSYFNDHGQIDSTSLCYYDHGQISSITHYHDGIRYGVHHTYYDTAVPNRQINWILDYYFPKSDSLSKPWTKIYIDQEWIFNDKGERVVWREYHRNGFIHKEEIWDIDNDFKTRITYHPNGQIETLGYKKNGKPTGHYQWYNEDGSLGRSWEYE